MIFREGIQHRSFKMWFLLLLLWGTFQLATATDLDSAVGQTPNDELGHTHPQESEATFQPNVFVNSIISEGEMQIIETKLKTLQTGNEFGRAGVHGTIVSREQIWTSITSLSFQLPH